MDKLFPENYREYKKTCLPPKDRQIDEEELQRSVDKLAFEMGQRLAEQLRKNQLRKP